MQIDPSKPVKGATRKVGVFVDHEPIRFNAKMARSEIPCRIEYSDNGPDGYGRRHFTLDWYSDHGDFYEVRGQCFHAVPSNHFELDTDQEEIS